MHALIGAGSIPHVADKLIDRIDERLAATGLTERGAALAAGLQVDTIRDLRREKKQSLSARSLAKLAAVLGTTADWLTGTQAAPLLSGSEPPPSRDPEFSLAGVPLPARSSMSQDVPVLGTAAGSVIKSVVGFQFEGGQIDMVRRPPALAGARDLYAIYVEGDSMDPVHPAGSLRFVHPHRPPLIGDTVVVMTKHHDGDPGQGYIKVLMKRTGTTLYLQQYNPAAVLEVPVQFVVSVHKVLTINDMFGL